MSSLYGCSEGEQDETLVLPLTAEAQTAPRDPSLAVQAPIVFRSDRGQSGIGDLYVMSLDGSSLRRLTEGGDFYVPAWSPDGETIAFRSSTGVGKTVGLIPVEGGPPVSITGNDERAEGDRPVHWSADGQRITYAGKDDDDGSVKVWEISRSGGQRLQLIPDGPHTQLLAEWAWGAATRMLYSLWTGPGDSDIWMKDGAGSDPVNLTRRRIGGPSYPRWSPDGSRIAFVGYPLASDGTIEGLGNHGEGELQVPDAEIFLIDASTGELQRLTDNTSEESGLAWSPDGQSLIVASDADGDTDLWLYSLEAPNEPRNLIDDSSSPSEERTPDWYWGSN